MRIDRFSMANSVEARVPFLDPALVEYVYRLPFDWKLRDGQTKLVLREAIADIVPDWVLSRPKQGFGAPVVDWFASRLTGVLRNLMAHRQHPGLLRHATRSSRSSRGPGSEAAATLLAVVRAQLRALAPLLDRRRIPRARIIAPLAA